jgi:hypothetical protein
VFCSFLWSIFRVYAMVSVFCEGTRIPLFSFCYQSTLSPSLFCSVGDRIIDIIEQFVERELAGETTYSEKTCPSATLSNTNPTWPNLGSNPGRRSGKSATNRLSLSTATSFPKYRNIHLKEVRVRAKIRLCGIYCGQSGQVLSEHFGFPCNLPFHRPLHSHHHHHPSSGTGTIGQIVTDIPTGLSLTPFQEIK